MAPGDRSPGPTAPEGVLVPELLEVEVPVGARVLVVSDLHLQAESTPASAAAAAELSQTLGSWTVPGVVVLAGDCFELLAGNSSSPGPALQAHPRLARALRDFAAAPNRRLLCLPGNHDGRLAWDARAVRALEGLTGAELALAVDLVVATGAGERRVRVEHGHQCDPHNAFADPRNPCDTPLGHHLVREIMPGLRSAPGTATWLAGFEELADPVAFPRFLASRLVYRRLARHGWWLLLPFLLTVALKLPVVYSLAQRAGRGEGLEAWSHRLAILGIGALVDVVLVALVGAIAFRRTWKALSGVVLAGRGLEQNDAPRARARQLVAAGGHGLITGHTHHPELTHLGPGFYANTGCGTEVVDECPVRLSGLGLPPVFLVRRELSWVELEAGAELHVRLLHARIDLPDGTLVERLLAKRDRAADAHPSVVATFPHGPSWPPVADPGRAQRRVRRVAASALAVAGLLNLASSFYPPQTGRLAVVGRLVPLAVPRAATALVALSGLALLFVAGGVRRGNRLAWTVATSLLAGSALLHLVKGADVEEAASALVVAGYLLLHRGAFRAGIDRPLLRRGLATLVGGAVGVTALSTAVLEASTAIRHHHRLPLGRALSAVLERLGGMRGIPLPARTDDFLSPALGAVGAGLALFAVVLALRPIVSRRRHETGDTMERAREVVVASGRGTLDYFALRSDKEHFFSGRSMVAYGLYGSVCLVSPDPIGPVGEREAVWADFRRLADAKGWILAVMGAGEEWLPTYRAAGMYDMYVGDEAVVDVTRFSLEGGTHKGLRQAVNRIARNGYTISFHDPAAIEPALESALHQVMTKSRRGDVERGFSMTLGRVFSPDDRGLLLAVASAADGHPVAFCQFVPAPGINGYSLDLMRRDDGEHPNGLLDFVVVETVRHLRDLGHSGLGLNFATMRAVLAGESGDTLTQRVERWLLKRMSDSMQIESLWRFNAKFDPDWLPRYAVYDSPEHALPAAIAVARAESFWELPVIGRFLKPEAKPDAPAQEPAPAPVEAGRAAR